MEIHIQKKKKIIKLCGLWIIYAIEIIHSEAYCKSIVAFIQKYNIPKEKVKYILQVKPIY